MKRLLLIVLLFFGCCKNRDYITVSQESDNACMLGDVVAVEPAVVKDGRCMMVVRCNETMMNVLIVGMGGVGPYPETKFNLKTVKYVKDLLHKKVEVQGVISDNMNKYIKTNSKTVFVADHIEECR
jgi:hypothetical protein